MGTKIKKNESQAKSLSWWKIISIIGVFVAVLSYYISQRKEPPKPSPIVEISKGKIQGIISYSREGKEVWEYLGIPYAKDPIKHRRFESPEPVDKWEGILDASKMGPKCLQVDIITQQTYGLESCLQLNVYVPKQLDESKSLATLVWIHGGIFMYGGADFFGPKYIVDEDIILVTISYRLGSFGFLNTGDGLVRGNMGLKDQVMALKWVQQNIKYFGGNPQMVTIFGESAGGSSVHLHQLSQMSKGLFYKAVSQSGTAISPFVLLRSPVEQSKRLGKQVGCPTENTQELVSCLKKIDALKLIEAQKETTDLLHESIAVFSPTIETIKDDDAFLTEDPMDLLREGKIVSKVPWINGLNSEEGLILSAVIVQNDTILKEMDDNWNDVAPKFFFYERNDTMSKLIREKYFGKTKRIGKPENLNKFTLMLSDRSFFWPASESALMQSKVSPVKRFHYIIEVLYDLFIAYLDKHVFGRRHHNYGCCHSDEIFIQFNTPITSDILPKDGEEYKMSKDFVKLWADFAKNHTEDFNFRGVKWPKVDVKKSPLRYLLIDMSYGMIDEPFESRISFWRENYVV